MNVYLHRDRSARGMLVVLALLLVALSAAPAAALEVTDTWHPLNAEFEYLDDPQGSITIDDLLANPAAYTFTPSTDSRPRGVFTPVWLRLELSFAPALREREFLAVARVENLYDLRVYREQPGGGYSELVTGNDHPAASRELDVPRYAFNIPAGRDSTTVYLRIVGGPGTQNLAWDLVEHERYQHDGHLYYLLTVSCIAAICALLVFNLLIALNLQRRDYLYYCGYVFCVCLSLVTVEGYGFKLLWPDAPWINERALHTFTLAAAALRMLAIDAFLGITGQCPRIRLMARAAMALLMLSIITVAVFGTPALPPLLPTLAWLVGILAGYVIAIQGVRLRVKLAWPLLICLVIPTLTAVAQGVLVVASESTGVWEMQLAKLGFTAHALMFSFCLAAHLREEIDSHQFALHDALTGLPGKQLLQERFEWMKTLATRQRLSLAVLFIDLDHFKQVNDRHGHAAGDELLQQATVRMQEALRESDVVARLGGDEFVALLNISDDDQAATLVSERLVQALSAPFYLDRGRVTIGASIGIARTPADGTDLDTLLLAADAAMYRVKENGRNGFLAAQLGVAA
ncbi:MAG: diguanylate cyclase [Halioglobus sp.]|nr:diguanylate cyclase [Halioglobus sp.]